MASREFDFFSQKGSTEGFALRVTEGLFRAATAQEVLERIRKIEEKSGHRPNLETVRGMIMQGRLAEMSDIEFRDFVRKIGINEISLTIDTPDPDSKESGVVSFFE